MKKSNFVALILGTIGMVFFALGMCMVMIQEWNLFRQGIVSGVIGLVIFLVTWIIWRKMEGKEAIQIKAKTIGVIVIALFGALLFGVGMCLCLVLDKFLFGSIVGIIGILVLLMLIPLTKGIQ